MKKIIIINILLFSQLFANNRICYECHANKYTDITFETNYVTTDILIYKLKSMPSAYYGQEKKDLIKRYEAIKDMNKTVKHINFFLGRENQKSNLSYINGDKNPTDFESNFK